MKQLLRKLFSRSEKGKLGVERDSILRHLFNEEFYLQTNPDVASGGMDALDHFLKYGFKERRLPCDESDIASAVISASKDGRYTSLVTQYQNDSEAIKDKNIFSVKTLVLPFHTKGNFFFKEISQHIAEAANAVGVKTILVDEVEFKKMVVSEDKHCFIVAPQELFYLGQKERLHQHAKSFAPNMTYLLAEQPQTVFFLSQLDYVFDDAHLVDMNFHVATYLRSLGIECHYLPLGWIDSLKVGEQREFGKSAEAICLPKLARNREKRAVSQRPIDAVFIGNGCERRQKFFSEFADQLSCFDMSVFMPDWKVPHESGGLATLDANDSIALCQNSKIFLNIHRDEFKYFEWHRICMRGFLSGALVLTEPVFSVPEFEAGVHYLECSLEEMPEKIDWLLNSNEGPRILSNVAKAGQEAYLKTSMTKSMSSYLSFVQAKAA